MKSVVAPLASGDRCRAWYEAHGGAVYRYLRFHAGSADEADDLTADVFLRVFEAQERYDPARAEVRVWIFGIARNVLRDSRRRAAVRRHVSLSDFRDLVCSAPSPEERLLQEERAGGLLAAMAQLPPAERELLALKYGSELSALEIGQMLGLKETAVRTRVWRTLGKLRNLMLLEGEDA